MYIFLDTETTGLLNTRDQIVQLSYIITDEEFNIVEAKNYFFDVDVEISEEATEVHGIDKEKLIELSGGKKFKDYAKDILWDFQSAKVICHNVQFDTSFLTSAFKMIDKDLNLSNTFCTMMNYEDILKLQHSYYGTKWPKLSEVVEFLQLNIDDLKMKAMELFGETGEFHDARLDVYTTYVIYKALREDIMSKCIEKIKEQANTLDVYVKTGHLIDMKKDIDMLYDIVNKLEYFEKRKE